MKFEDKDRAVPHGVHGQRADNSEALLRAEIGFWRELLQECNQSVPADSIERMRQALALAEQRFLQLCREAGGHAESSDRLRQTSRTNGKYLH